MGLSGLLGIDGVASVCWFVSSSWGFFRLFGLIGSVVVTLGLLGLLVFCFIGSLVVACLACACLVRHLFSTMAGLLAIWPIFFSVLRPSPWLALGFQACSPGCRGHGPAKSQPSRGARGLAPRSLELVSGFLCLSLKGVAADF